MKRRFVYFSILMTAGAFAADTAKQRIDNPVLGYAFSEQAGELRAMLGVPGSARWSDALRLPDGVTAMRLAPGHRWGLVQLESGEAGVLELDTLAYTRIAASLPVADAVFSPAGTAAAVRAGDRVSVITGLPGTAEVREAVTSPEGSRIAVSDSGMLAELSAGRLTRGGKFVADGCEDECLFAFFPGSAGALAFASGTRLLEIDSDGGQREIVADLAARSGFLLASESSVVMASGERIRTLDRQSGAMVRDEELATGAAVTKLQGLRIAGTLLLSDAEDEPVWMYSSEGVRFVPVRTAAVKE